MPKAATTTATAKARCRYARQRLKDQHHLRFNRLRLHGHREWFQNHPTASTDADVVHLHVAGELDMATADHLRAVLHQAVIQPGTTRIVIDFADVSFCDSSGIEVLDRAYGEAHDAGIGLRLANPQPIVRRVLDLVGVLETLTVSH